MRISFTGSGGTGKSSIVSRLSVLAQFKDYTVVDSVTRELFAKGIPINEAGDNFNNTQLLVMNKHLEVLLTNENLLSSRCLLDGYCYTSSLWNDSKVATWIYNYAKQIMMDYLNRYDFIFYIKPEFDLVNDGIRSSNKEWRDNIAKTFETNVNFLQIHNMGGNIIQISGTVEERLQQVWRALAL